MTERVKHLVASLPNTVQAEHVRTRQLSPPIASCGSMFTAAVGSICPGDSCSSAHSAIPVATLCCSAEPVQRFSSLGRGSCSVAARAASPVTPRPPAMRAFSAVLARSAMPETPRREEQLCVALQAGLGGSMFTAAVRGSYPGNSCSGSRSPIPVTTLRCSGEPTQCFSSMGGGSCSIVARPATPETPRPAVMRGFSAVLARSATPETPRRVVVRTFSAASAPRTSEVFGGSCSTASSVRIVPPAVKATTAHGAQVRGGGTPSWPGPAAARPSLGWQSVVVCPVEDDVQEALRRPRWRPP